MGFNKKKHVTSTKPFAQCKVIVSIKKSVLYLNGFQYKKTCYINKTLCSVQSDNFNQEKRFIFKWVSIQKNMLHQQNTLLSAK